jgi:hypothetical protein
VRAIEEILNSTVDSLYWSTNDSMEDRVFRRIVSEVERVHGRGSGGEVMISDVTMTYHPCTEPNNKGTTLGVYVLDWIEAVSSEGRVRIVRTEAPGTGQRPSQINYATKNDDYHFVMILMVRFG